MLVGSIAFVFENSKPLDIMLQPFFLHVTFGVLMYASIISLLVFEAAGVNYTMFGHRWAATANSSIGIIYLLLFAMLMLMLMLMVVQGPSWLDTFCTPTATRRARVTVAAVAANSWVGPWRTPSTQSTFTTRPTLCVFSESSAKCLCASPFSARYSLCTSPFTSMWPQPHQRSTVNLLTLDL